MAGSTPIFAWPYPTLSDSPHGPNQIQALALGVESTLNGFDVPGLISDVAALLAWRAVVEGLDTQSDIQSTSGTTGSTSYTATLTGGTACGFSFVAPASGKVLIFNSCFVSPSTSNGFASVRVRTGAVVGSGTDVLAASDAHAVIPNASGYVRGTSVIPVPGLTPGSSYNAQQMFRIDVVGTLTVRDKVLALQPQL